MGAGASVDLLEPSPPVPRRAVSAQLIRPTRRIGKNDWRVRCYLSNASNAGSIIPGRQPRRRKTFADSGDQHSRREFMSRKIRTALMGLALLSGGVILGGPERRDRVG